MHLLVRGLSKVKASSNELNKPRKPCNQIFLKRLSCLRGQLVRLRFEYWCRTKEFQSRVSLRRVMSSTQARYLGVISKDEYLKLTDLHKYRNAIAHGFSHDDLGIEMVLELIETARRLTNEQSTEEYAQT